MNPSTNSRLETALYVVATPIGNLDDLSPRAAHVLRNVTMIAAEDTRRTGLLIKQAVPGSGAAMISAHAHNEHEAANRLIAQLTDEQPCALVSDAGTPAISDPGARIVARVREAGYRIIAIPGPSAVTALLSVAGFDAGRFGSDAQSFVFAGFLPTGERARESRLRELAGQPASIVILEAPHRIATTIDAMCAVFGPDRQIVIGRELTKQFEQVVAMPLSQAPAWLDSDSNHRRGEFVLALAPATRPDSDEEIVNAQTPIRIETTVAQLLQQLLDRLPASQAAGLAQTITGLPRKKLYDTALELQSTESAKNVKR